MPDYCFVLMPIGVKPDPDGGPPIDFDRVYAAALEPAIREAGLEPLRDDADPVGGIMQRRIFQGLLLCEYAIADLTTANANVLYELGIRHAVRPYTTLSVAARPDRLPFDVGYLRAVRYELGAGNRLEDAAAANLRGVIAASLRQLRDESGHREPAPDSPLFQLLTEWEPPSLASLKTDRFSQEVRFNEDLKRRLADLRHAGTLGDAELLEARSAAAEIRRDLAATRERDSGMLVELMLTFRALEDWDAMIGLIEEMPGFLRARVLVQEQLAFAYNRRAQDSGDADRERALRVLEGVIAQQGGASAETAGLLGRVHKDRWQHFLDSDPDRAAGHLAEAIRAYSRGYRADPRDPYPGINAVILLEIEGSETSLGERDRLLPVVRYAAERLAEDGEPTYWEQATLLALAVIARDPAAAENALQRARTLIRERWEPATTARDLRLIAHAWDRRGEDSAWLRSLADRLA